MGHSGHSMLCPYDCNAFLQRFMLKQFSRAWAIAGTACCAPTTAKAQCDGLLLHNNEIITEHSTFDRPH